MPTQEDDPTLSLPPYLRSTEPMEIDDLPLQVSLLTMEIANLRMTLQRVSTLLKIAALEAGDS